MRPKGLRNVPPRGHGVGYTGGLSSWEYSAKEESMSMTTFATVLALALGGWATRLWVLAQRAEHLVVLRLDGGTFLLARQPDGRFLLINPLRAPAVLARFEVMMTVERYRAVRAALARPLRWTRATAHLH